jgi:hypothetical protein
MRKLVAVAVTGAALVVAAPASADPGNGKGGGGDNGCGELFSMLGAPGFGDAVSDVAREGGFSDSVHLLCRDILP